MSCDELGERLSALVDGELPPREVAELEAHIEVCPACAERFDQLDRTAGLVGTLGAPPPSADFLTRLDDRLRTEMAGDGMLTGAARPSAKLRAVRPRGRMGFVLRRVAAALLLVASGYALHAALTLRHTSEGANVPAPEDEVAEHVVRESAPDAASQATTESPAVVVETPTRDVRGETRVASTPPRKVTEPVREQTTPPPVDGPAVAKVPPDTGSEPAPTKVRAVEDRDREKRSRQYVAVFADARTHDERVAALFELAQLGTKDATRVMQNVLSVDNLVRERTLSTEAIRAIGTFPWKDGLLTLLSVASYCPIEVRAALARVDDPDLLAWLTMDVLPKLGDDTPQAVLAEALAERRAPGAGEAIAGLIPKSRDIDTKVRLLRTLASFEGTAVEEVLVAALASTSAAVRVAAARAIGCDARDDAFVATALLPHLDDRATEVRVAIAAGLASSAAPEAVDVLVHLRANDPHAAVRGQALFSLQRISGEGIFDAAHWSAWWAEKRLAPLLRGPGTIVLTPARRESYFGIPVFGAGIVFLLDISQSMQHDGKLERAEQELGRVMSALEPGTLFQVGAFANATTFAFSGLRQADVWAVRDALAWVRSRPRDGAQTNLSAAIERALEMQNFDQVFLLTDGTPTAGLGAERLREKVREWTWDGRVRIHTIGLFRGDAPLRVDERTDAREAAVFLRALAEDTGGVFIRND